MDGAFLLFVGIVLDGIIILTIIQKTFNNKEIMSI